MKNEKCNIFPTAFIPKLELKCKTYYLEIPERWQEKILYFEEVRTNKKNNSNNVFTKILKLSLDLWGKNIVKIFPLNSLPKDKKWIVAYNKLEISKIFICIKNWIQIVYGNKEEIKEEVSIFLKSMEEKELKENSKEIILFDKQGMIGTDYSYDLIKVYIANLIIDKSFFIDGKKIKFNYAGEGKFVSDIQSTGDSIFSYGLLFSLQTIPPFNKPLLLCNFKIHKWIPGIKNENIYFKDNINAKIWNGNKICEIPIVCKYDKKTKTKSYYWKEYERKAYDSFGGETLPEAKEVILNPELNLEKITLPYRYTLNNSGFRNNKAGSGMSIKEKAQFFSNISEIIGDFFIPVKNLEKIKNKVKISYNKNELKENITLEQRKKFRKRVMECLVSKDNKLNIEIYSNYLNSDSYCVEEIYNRLKEIIGGEECEDKFQINIYKKTLGNFGMPLSHGTKNRVEEIKKGLKFSEGVTACIVLLPGKEAFSGEENSDPKDAIRIGFALSGRLTQFIMPWEKLEDENFKKETLSKIDSTIGDLFRQLGYLPEEKKDLEDSIYIGMTALKIKNDSLKEDNFCPVFIKVDFKKGEVYLESSIFGKLLYREALIELIKLSYSKEIIKKVEENSSKILEKKLKNLNILYENRKIIFLVESFKNTNEVFSGITNLKIAKYKYLDKYIPEEIILNEENKKINLANTSIRIIRIKQNEEVPDYITTLKDENSSEYVQASDVIKFEDIFWIIQSRPNEKSYIDSYKKTSIINPKQEYKQKNILEVFPVQLQPGDKVEDIVRNIEYLKREDMFIQYRRGTILPFPLHLLKKVEEYIIELK